ncbi:MAG: restriction endonuclease subunit S, partial [Bacteroidetes bacterium]|nr:restriction endonuclease subunit S [Bacteroidota bacterium]
MENGLPEGWVIRKIENVTDILDNMRKPVNAKERAKRQGEIPYYGATGQTGWIDDYIFNEELVLLGEDGAPFFDKSKDVAYLINGKSWVNNHAHVIRAKKGITTNGFILHFLNHFDYQGFVGGTTRLKLNQGNLKKIPFPLPPLPEQ